MCIIVAVESFFFFSDEPRVRKSSSFLKRIAQRDPAQSCWHIICFLNPHFEHKYLYYISGLYFFMIIQMQETNCVIFFFYFYFLQKRTNLIPRFKEIESFAILNKTLNGMARITNNYKMIFYNI